MTSESIAYARAPVAEALLDVRVDVLDSDVLGRLIDFGDPEYPRRTEQTLEDVELASGTSGVATKVERRTNGYTWVSDDGRNMVQMRVDGFACGQLAPYTGWDAFYREARRIWLTYVARVGQLHVRRASLRYVNQIHVPSDGLDIAHYLKTRPEVADELGSPVTGFYLGLECHLSDFDVSARLVETVLPGSADDSRHRLVLDIDVYRTLEQELSENDCDMKHWDLAFADLHRAKNHLFESSITESTRRLFQ